MIYQQYLNIRFNEGPGLNKKKKNLTHLLFFFFLVKIQGFYFKM